MRLSIQKILIACIVLAGSLSASAVYAAQNHTITAYSSSEVDEYGTCYSVYNSNPRNIFIPTNTSNEWMSFWSRVVSGVSLSQCGYGGCTDPSALNYDSGASWDNGTCSYPPPPPPPPTCSPNAGNSCSSTNSCRQTGYYDCSGTCVPPSDSSCPGPGPYCFTYDHCTDYRYVCNDGSYADTCGYCYAVAPVTYCYCYDAQYNMYTC